MRTNLLRLVPAAALFAAACGAGETGGGGTEEPGSDETTGQEERVYQGAMTVLENSEHGPQLCGAVATSHPPQCGGLDVVGWDWEEVEHESASGVTWGQYLVTGTFDGEAFVLTEDPVPTSEIDMDDYPHLEPSEPEVEEPAERLSDEELRDVVREFSERFPATVVGGGPQPEYGVAWIDTVLVTPEMEAAAEEYPEGVIVFTQMLQPVP